MNTYFDMISNGISYDDCVHAGYFEDEYISDEHIQKLLYGSDFDDLIKNRANELNPDIIISMAGCFSPIHHGHLGAVRAAKKYYEQQGLTTMLVMIPANDSYVDIKRSGECKMPAMQRIQYMKSFFEQNNINDIVIDEHPALSMPYELNFPYLLQRISTLCPGVKQSFVVGADNQGFALALRYMNHDAVILPRDGIDVDISALFSKYGFTLDGMHIIKQTDFSHLSSTLIRKNVSISDHAPSGTYFIRDDSMFIGDDIDTSRIINAFKQTFSDINVYVIDAGDQVKLCSKHVSEKYSDYFVLSMDKYFNGDFQIRCSRVFEKNSFQKNPVSYYIQNKNELIQYLKTLPANSKVLIVDDDISSGYSYNTIRNIVMEYVDGVIVKGFFMNLHYMKENDIVDEVYDIVDMRDFINGAPNGGLLTNSGRVPYRYPYVNLFTRAKVPFNKVIEFNKLIWG